MARLTAVLDANVLYSAGLRDLLLRLADRHLFSPLWSAAIHDEWIRNLSANRIDIPSGALERVRDVMNQHFPDAVVTGYESFIGLLVLPDDEDRHVLAAIHGKADVIVTANLKDFPANRLSPYAVDAKNPDTFIVDLFETSRPAVLAAVRGHRAALRNPPFKVIDYLENLERLGLYKTASLLRTHNTVI